MKSEGANRVKGKTVWLILLVIIVSCAFLIPVAYDRSDENPVSGRI